MSGSARRSGRLPIALGGVAIVAALVVLVVVDPAATGPLATIRYIAGMAVPLGLFLVIFGLLSFVPAPRPTSAEAQALARARAKPSRWWRLAVFGGAFYLVLAALDPAGSPSWWLIAGGVWFLAYGVLLYFRERKRNASAAGTEDP